MDASLALPVRQRPKPSHSNKRSKSSGGGDGGKAAIPNKKQVPIATSRAEEPKPALKRNKAAISSSSSSREQQAGQPSGEGCFAMTEQRPLRDSPAGSQSTSRANRADDATDMSHESSTVSAISHAATKFAAASATKGGGDRQGARRGESDLEDSRSSDGDSDDHSSSSTSLASGFNSMDSSLAKARESAKQEERVGRADAANRAASAPQGASSSSNGESFSLLQKAWRTTEEFLPSSCSSSDAEASDASSLDDEDSFACSTGSTSSSSSSSVSSSFLDDEGGIEYVEYFEGDHEGARRTVVFLHMPPPPRGPASTMKVAAAKGSPAPPSDRADWNRSAPAAPGLLRPAGAGPPGRALRQPPVGGGPTGRGEIEIRPSDLLSQIAHPSRTAPAASQGMPPLVDLVDVDESDDEDEEVDDSDDDGSSDSSDSDEGSDDESSIDESDYRDILQQQQQQSGKLLPPAAFLNATKAGPPRLQPLKPSSGSAPLDAQTKLPPSRSQAPHAPLPRPTVTAPAKAAHTSSASLPAQPAHNPRIPMELQAVFLASQQGEVVDKPPSSGAAFHVFGSWFGRSSRKGGAAPRLLPSMLQRRQQPPRHQEERPLQQQPTEPPSSQGKGGASRRIAQFFRSKQLRKQQSSSSSFRRMPQLPEISEISCSMDSSVARHSISGVGGDAELASIKEDVGRNRAPSSPVRRSFSVRSFGSSRRSSVGSAVSSSSAVSSAASANSTSSASPHLRKGGPNSRGSHTRQGQRGVGTRKDGSRCSESSTSWKTEDSRGSSHPVASIGSAVTDDDDNSSHSWDSGVSDLSSDDEALYADLEQMLSQAKAAFASKKGLSTPAIRLPQDLKTQAAPTLFAPTVPSFIRNSKQSPARPPSAQVNVYVPASPSPTRPRATPRPAPNDKEPTTPVFTVAQKQALGQNAFEPTIPTFSEKKIKKAPSTTSFASSQASRPTLSRAPSQAQPTSSAPPTRTSSSSRIPLELQEIFLRSNAGENVEEILPPTNGNAFKVFTRRSGSVWPSLLRRNPSRRPLLVTSKSKRQCSASKGGDHPKADQSVQSATGNTADMSSPLTASPVRAPKEIVYVPRIPEELQEIFVQSNRGEEVHQPPRSGAAFKVFEKRADIPHNLHHQPMTLNRLYMDWRVNNSAT
jgi:hypothetical protein